MKQKERTFGLRSIVASCLTALTAVGLVGSARGAATYYWIGGATGSWNQAANWSLTDGGEAASTYPNASDSTWGVDTAVFNSDVTVTVSGSYLIKDIQCNASVTLTGGGTLKQAKDNNGSNGLNITGSGSLHLSSINVNFPYNTAEAKSTSVVSVPVEICANTENAFYCAAGGSRYTFLKITGAITGAGHLKINAAYTPRAYLTLPEITSGFTGTIENAASIANLVIGGGRFAISAAGAIPSSSITFKGGELYFNPGITGSISATISNSSSAIVIGNGEGSEITYAGTLSGNSGGVTKTGPGKLSLTSTSLTYNGTTTVSSGVLSLALGVTLPGSIVVDANQGAKVEFQGDNMWENGSIHTLLNFASSDAANYTSMSSDDLKSIFVINGLGTRQSYTLDASTGSLIATVSSVILEWAGANDATWSTGGGNWANDLLFAEGDVVRFSDSAFIGDTASLTVNVSGDVAPSAVVLSPGEGHTYVFAGEGKVTTSNLVLDKSGAGSLELGSDVLYGLSINNTEGSLVINPGQGKTVNLTSVSNSDANNVATIKSGTLSLPSMIGHSVTIDTGAALSLSSAGTATIYERTISGSGDVYLTSGTFYVDGNNHANNALEGFTGTIHAQGITYQIHSRGAGYVSTGYKAPLGKGTFSMEGCTLWAPDGNSQQEYYLYAQAINVKADTQNYISNENRSHRIVADSALTGAGTLTVSAAKSSNSGDYRGVAFTGNNAGFSGTLNFANTLSPSSSEDVGLLSAQAGSSLATFNVTGAPSALTKLLNFKVSDSGTLSLGALNIASANAAIWCNQPLTMSIGNKEDCTINGKFALQNGGTYKITKVGSSTLTFGSDFGMADAQTLGLTADDYTGNSYTKTLTVSSGSVVANCDITSVFDTISLYSGASIKFLTSAGDKTGDITLPTGNGYAVKTATDGDYTVYTVVDNTASTWQGADGADWNTGSNWSTGVVPSRYTAVTINNTESEYLSIELSDAAYCASMDVSGNVAFCQSGDGYTSTNPINIYGEVTAKSGSGTVKLIRCGVANQSSTAQTFAPNLVIANKLDGSGNVADSWASGWNGTADVPFTFTGDVRVEGKFVLWNWNHKFTGNVTLADGAYMGNWHNLPIILEGATITAEGNGAYIYGPIAGSGVTFNGALKLGYTPSAEMPGWWNNISAGYGTLEVTAAYVKLADSASITAKSTPTFSSSPEATTSTHAVVVTTDANTGTTTYTDVDNSASTWNPAGDGKWSTASNWSTGVVPGAYTAVTFPAAESQYTVAADDGVSCGSITVSGDVLLNHGTESWASVNVYGDISGEGTLTLGDNLGLRSHKAGTFTISSPLCFAGSSHALHNWISTQDGATTAIALTGNVTLRGFYEQNMPTTFSCPVYVTSDSTIETKAGSVAFSSTVSLSAGVTLTVPNGTTFVAGQPSTTVDGYKVVPVDSTANSVVYHVVIGVEPGTSVEIESEAAASSYEVTLTEAQVAQGLQASYYKTLAYQSESKWYVCAVLDETKVRPSVEGDAKDGAMEVTTSSVSLNVTDAKAGLYYGIAVGDSTDLWLKDVPVDLVKCTENGKLKLTGAAMPGSDENVKYYKVVVSDVDKP